MKEQLYLVALLDKAPENIKNTILNKAQITDTSAFASILVEAHICVCGKKNLTNEADLVSAFKNIVGTEAHYYQAQPLSLEKTFFPTTGMGVVEADKNKLWTDFLAEANLLTPDRNNLLPFIETILHLLHKYAVTLPNPSTYLPDVSYYDYAKMTAAMAICLDQTDTPDKPFLLVKADMSGIQNYIYEIVSKAAAKNLKGRSFYVQLLSDAILRKLLNTFNLPQANFNLPQANIVYNSGGNFLLLLPNTEANEQEVAIVEKEIAEQLFSTHKTTIAVIIDSVAIAKDDLIDGTHCITKALAEKIEEKKKRKFANYIDEHYSDLFDPQKVKPQDKVTGEDIEKSDMDSMLAFRNDTLFQKQSNGDDADFVCKKDQIDLKLLTFQQICLGRRLKKADYLVVSSNKIVISDIENQKYLVEPANLGIYYYLVENKKDLDAVSAANANNALRIYSLNQFDFIAPEPKPKHQYGFMLYGGNEAPTFEYNYKDEEENKLYNEGKAKTFSHLTLRLSNKGGTTETVNLASIKRLGVMLLDVDGLGTVFKDTNFESFAQYAAFSRHLDYFFLGYLNTLWNSHENYKQHIQIIYAGGDDLFIVGRWDLVIDFAELIKNELLAWSCQTETEIKDNPKISISGGIAVVTHKFPIMKAAEMAKEAEGKAKGYSIDEGATEIRKNAITLWGTPLNWELEYPIVQELKKEIDDYIDGYKGVFMNLQDYYNEHSFLEKEGWEAEKKAGKKPTKKERYSWKYSNHIRWRVAYYIARTQDRYKGDANLRQLLETLKQGIFANSYRNKPLQGSHQFFDLLNLAIRWAELNYRTNHKK